MKIFRGSTDAILVDGFDGLQIVDALTTEDFFEDCKRALSPKGCSSPTGGAGTNAISPSSSVC